MASPSQVCQLPVALVWMDLGHRWVRLGLVACDSLRRKHPSLIERAARRIAVSDRLEVHSDYYALVSLLHANAHLSSLVTHSLLTLTSSDLVVLSIDFTMTRIFGVMGELACFKGLKFRMAETILFATAGRVRMRRERELSVASTSTASLPGRYQHMVPLKSYSTDTSIPCTLVEDVKQSVEET